MKIQRSASVLAAFSLLASIGMTASYTTPASAGNACSAISHSNDGLKSFHMQMTMSGAHKVVMTADEVKPDRMHTKMNDMEMVIIGSKTWMNQSGGGWKTLNMKMNAADFLGNQGSFIDSLMKEQHTSCVDAGLGLWGGKPMHLYKVSGTTRGQVTTGTVYMGLDGYLHHAETNTGPDHAVIDESQFNSASVNPPI